MPSPCAVFPGGGRQEREPLGVSADPRRVQRPPHPFDEALPGALLDGEERGEARVRRFAAASPDRPAVDFRRLPAFILQGGKEPGVNGRFTIVDRRPLEKRCQRSCAPG